MAVQREQLTEKAKAAISRYVYLRAEAFMLHDRLIELVLEAERMPRDRLYTWLEGEGWHWRSEFGNWIQRTKTGGAVLDKQSGWHKDRQRPE